jgi:hypothetical protein
MVHNYKPKGSPARLKRLLMLVLVSGLLSTSIPAFSQTPPPGNPPPPPPPPGELFKKINPFKKHKDTVNKKDTAKTRQPAVVPAGGPPPPPNPLNLFKKKKKDTTTKPVTPAGH